MEEKGKEVLTEVPPGPDNPLAGYWIGLSVGGYGIHGTNAPATVYDYRSHGCIRMNRADAAKLFNYAYVGQPVEIIYKPVLLTRTKDGKIFAEVHKDVYNVSRNPVQEIQRSVESSNLNKHLDWNRVKEVAQDKEGIAREVDSGNPSKPSS
jgi:L,D-transpeptidase ErfK/SrfK